MVILKGDTQEPLMDVIGSGNWKSNRKGACPPPQSKVKTRTCNFIAGCYPEGESQVCQTKKPCKLRFAGLIFIREGSLRSGNLLQYLLKK